MLNNIESFNGQDVLEKTVELASLIGLYFSRNNYKELLEKDFKIILKLKKGLKSIVDLTQKKIIEDFDGKTYVFDQTNISELEKLINERQQEYNKLRNEIKQGVDLYIKGIIPQDVDNNKIENDLKLDQDFTFENILLGMNQVNILERIRELYSDEGVRQLYEEQLRLRKKGFDMLQDGNKNIKELLEIEAIIKKAKDIILKMRIEAFMNRKILNSAEISIIRRFQRGIVITQNKLQQLLKKREVATVYRLNSLKKYKHQLETSGFVNVLSREVIIEKVIEKLLLGENVLLTGSTGTGKTVIALEAVKKMANQMNFLYEEVNGKMLGDEIKNNLHGTKSLLDEFSIVLSGHSGITTSEFIAKPSLKSDGKGGTYTDTQLGKLLKAFVEGKIPIIDEIDLIPNDILMRIKHLFTLKPGQKYSPQEDGDSKLILKTTSIIATANIKSEKHPDREELDPAIVRLFKGIQVPYLTLDESFDVAIAHLMENGGYIYDIDLNSLGEGSILYNLIKSLKEIEESYLGIGSGLNINISGSDKSGLFLQKAVLELGNFVSMFKGFKESGLSFKEFIKLKVIEFVSNGAYPKNDRLILIKIFSINGLLIQSDIPILRKLITDISDSEFEKNIMGINDIFTNEGPIKFIDPYELANLDPYKVRKLEQLDVLYENSRLIGLLKEIGEKYLSTGTQVGEILVKITEHILDQFELNPDYEITDQEIKTLGELLYKESDTEILGRLFLLGDKWKVQLEKLIKNDTEDKLFIIQIGGPFEDCGDFQEGIARVKKEDGKRYFINKDLSELFGPFENCGDFQEGIAKVKKEDGKLYFIKRDGSELGGPFEFCGDFQEGIASVIKEDGKRYFIKRDTSELLGPFEDCQNFIEGIARVEKEDGKRYFIKKDGSELLGPFEGCGDFQEGIAKVRKEDGKLYFIKKDGSKLGGPFEDCENFHKGIARVKKEDRKRYFIKSDGSELLGPFEDCDNFYEGIARVKKEDRKRYLIKRDGSKLLGPFEDCDYCYEGIAKVKKEDRKRYFIKSDGSKLGGPFEDCDYFYEGIAKVKKEDRKRYFIKRDGSELGGPFEFCRYFIEGIARVKKEDGKRYFIKRDGSKLGGPFEDCDYFYEGIAKVKKEDGKRYFIKKDGSELGGPFEFCGDFKEGIARVKKEDGKRYYFSINISINSIEFQDISKNLTEYIINSYNRRINKLKSEGKMEVDGGEIEVNLLQEDLKGLKEINLSDIKVLSNDKKVINIEGKKEQFYIVQLEIRGLRFTAIQVPNELKNKPLKDMEMGFELNLKQDKHWFPNIDFEKGIGTSWIIEETENHKGSDGNTYTNLTVLSPSNMPNILNLLAKLGMKTISIRESIVLGEIVKYGLGLEYINFNGNHTSSAFFGYQDTREKVEEIDKYLGMKFGEYKIDPNGEFMISNRSIYIDIFGHFHSLYRGGGTSQGCNGGVFTLELNCILDQHLPGDSFRASV